jgi:hypothetical protein
MDTKTTQETAEEKIDLNEKLEALQFLMGVIDDVSNSNLETE